MITNLLTLAVIACFICLLINRFSNQKVKSSSNTSYSQKNKIIENLAGFFPYALILLIVRAFFSSEQNLITAYIRKTIHAIFAPAMTFVMTYFELILTSVVVICLIFYIIDGKSYRKERNRLYKAFKTGTETEADRKAYGERLQKAQRRGIKSKLMPYFNSACAKIFPVEHVSSPQEVSEASSPETLAVVPDDINVKKVPLSGKELYWATHPVYFSEKFIEFFSGMFWILFIVWFVRSFLWEPFQIPSASMEPTLQNGDFILTNKYSYGIRLPVLHTKILPTGSVKRGDIIVFRYPPEPNINYIKRVIGLPGDEIIVNAGRVSINGKPPVIENLNKVHIGHDNRQEYDIYRENLTQHPHLIQFAKDSRYRMTSALATYSGQPFQLPENISFKVPDGQYFVMGDNRDNSVDSRFWGFVPEANLVGKATFIWMNSDCITFKGFCSRIGTTLK